MSAASRTIASMREKISRFMSAVHGPAITWVVTTAAFPEVPPSTIGRLPM